MAIVYLYTIAILPESLVVVGVCIVGSSSGVVVGRIALSTIPSRTS